MVCVHAALLQLVVFFLRDAGMQPIPGSHREGERPDLRLNLGTTNLLLDLSVTHPTMPSALTTGRSSRPLGAAKQREYEKIHKYTHLAVIENATVIPLVLETTGALGEGLRQFIHRIASQVHDGEFAGASPLVVERFLISALAITLQRGNAAMLREGTSQFNHSSEPQQQRYFQSRTPHFSSYPNSSCSTRAAFGWADDPGRDSSSSSSSS